MDAPASVVSAAVDLALDAGSSSAEVLLSQGTSVSIRVFEGQVDSLEHSQSSGLGFRVIVDGREGYAHTERLDEDGIRSAASWAVQNAALGREDKGAAISDFPDGPSIAPSFTEELASVPLSDKVDLARKVEEDARSTDPRIVNVPHVGYYEGDFELFLANSAGLERSRRANYAGIYCVPLAVEGDSRQTGYKVEVSRSFPELKQKPVGSESARRALDLLGASPIDTGSIPVVFENLSFCDLLSTFIGMFSGKAAEEGRTVLAGRSGERIARPGIRIIDDATLDGGFVSRPFDFEGHPTSRFELVSGGLFNGFMHNSATARRAGVPGTGHAFRGYKSPLGIAPSNCFVEGDSAVPLDSFLSSCSRALMVVQLEGLHAGANGLNGDFSLGAKGFLVENGKRSRPVEGVTVSGNFLSLLDSVSSVADDFKFDTPGGTTCFGAPSVLVDGLTVAGGS